VRHVVRRASMLEFRLVGYAIKPFLARLLG